MVVINVSDNLIDAGTLGTDRTNCSNVLAIKISLEACDDIAPSVTTRLNGHFKKSFVGFNQTLRKNLRPMATLKQLRSHRIHGVAMFDVVGSYLAGYLIAKYVGLDPIKVAWSILPLSIAVHALLKVDTVFTDSFFDPDSSWLFKLLVVISLFMATH
jgi:hypothetical protein